MADERTLPIVVTICGGSGSGKSGLAAALAGAAQELKPAVLEQDWYFRDFAEYPPEERDRVRTANHPDAVAWPAFHAAFDALVAGGRVQVPAPGTRRHGREPTRELGPCDLLVVAGLFTLWDEHCRERADLRLFTEVDDDERVLRRISRDVRSRGSTVERAVAWYRRDVRPNYPRYTAAYKTAADLVVPTEYETGRAVTAICHAVRAMAAEASR